jgi:hypothetical protein
LVQKVSQSFEKIEGASTCHDNRSGDHATHGIACHCRLLIAETSCEMKKLFLDRSLLVPSLARGGSAEALPSDRHCYPARDRDRIHPEICHPAFSDFCNKICQKQTHAVQQSNHSITASASASSFGGISTRGHRHLARVNRQREEPDVQWKAAAFARWHEPDDARR